MTTTPSPAFGIMGGLPGVKFAATPGQSLTATLDDVAGVSPVVWFVNAVDDTKVATDYPLVPSGGVSQTVGWTAGDRGTAGELRVRVAGGIDPRTGNPSAAMEYSCKWYVPTEEGLEVLVAGELEDDNRLGSATFGAVAAINALIRNGGRLGDWKPSVRFATTAALQAHTRSGSTLTASGNGAFPATDGVTPVLNDTFLAKNEAASHLEHGCYQITQLGDGSHPWIATRVSWMDASAELTAMALVPVEAGTVNGGRLFALTTANPITVNTTALTFVGLPTVVDVGAKVRFLTADRDCAAWVEARTAFGAPNKVLHVGFNDDGLDASQPQHDFTMPLAAFVLEHSASDAADHDRRLVQTHFPYFVNTIAKIVGTVVGPWNLNNGDTLVVKVGLGGVESANRTATIQPGDITVGAATADQLKVVIDRDLGPFGAYLGRLKDGRAQVYTMPTATATTDSIRVVSGNIATALGLTVGMVTASQFVNRAAEVKTNWATNENEVTVNGALYVSTSDTTAPVLSLPESSSDITATWGSSTKGVSHLIGKNNVAALSQRNADGSSQPVLLKFDASNILQILPVGTYAAEFGGDVFLRREADHAFKVRDTSTSNTAGGALTVQAGLATGSGTGGNLNLFAGGSASGTKGTVVLGDANTAGVTCAQDFTIASGKSYKSAGTLDIRTTGANAITIESVTGDIHIGTDATAKLISIGTGGASISTTIGTLSGGTTTLISGSGGMLFKTNFAQFGFTDNANNDGRGVEIARDGNTQWRFVGTGAVTDLKIGFTKCAFFNGTPHAQPAITGALSSVTDANAKAVLTSVIAALKGTAGLNLATDSTT